MVLSIGDRAVGHRDDPLHRHVLATLHPRQPQRGGTGELLLYIDIPLEAPHAQKHVQEERGSSPSIESEISHAVLESQSGPHRPLLATCSNAPRSCSPFWRSSPRRPSSSSSDSPSSQVPLTCQHVVYTNCFEAERPSSSSLLVVCPRVFAAFGRRGQELPPAAHLLDLRAHLPGPRHQRLPHLLDRQPVRPPTTPLLNPLSWNKVAVPLPWRPPL